MTWQMGTFLVVVAMLIAGFAWYERTHPSTHVLALVATLAALAVLGRIAFAPVPNVKPTLDIVLIAGFVLGGAPGFAVGAVGALASNMFFGQGPWTPWQMLAWGLVGIFGAALGRATGRQLGRVPLALACGVAGYACGTLLDLATWVSFGGGEEGQLAVLLARGVPFNLALAAGNVAFCLAFGPALVRALERFRGRFEVTWHPAGAALGAVLAAVVLVAGALAPAPAEAATPTQYLRTVQNRDGGYGPARGQGSTGLHSSWVAMGLAAAGRDPGRGLGRYLRADARRVRSAGDIERTILALRAARQPLGDLPAKLLRKRSRDGSFGGLVNLTSFGVLALRAAGRDADDRTVRGAASWLSRQQNDDGGFSFDRRGAPSGIDDTAAAVQGLVAAGRTGAVPKAVDYLVRQQQPDGGFPLTEGAGSNAMSTAWAIQALIAAGREPAEVRRGNSRSPLAYLRSLVAPDGSVRYSRTSRQTPVWATAQALTALARKPLPISPVRRRATARRASVPGPVAALAGLAGAACASLLAFVGVR